MAKNCHLSVKTRLFFSKISYDETTFGLTNTPSSMQLCRPVSILGLHAKRPGLSLERNRILNFRIADFMQGWKDRLSCPHL